MSEDFVECPTAGRIFATERTVSITDCASDGRMEVDAVARFLNDVANDDTDDAGISAFGLAWVARRMAFEVEKFPQSRERLLLTTWCSGSGQRWAERRTTITGVDGAKIEAQTLWIHVDPLTGRPIPWGKVFEDVFLASTLGRTVDTKLRLAKRPSPDISVGPNRPATETWRFRRTDMDMFDHVNNAAYLTVLEESLSGKMPPAPARFEVEWHRASTCDEQLTITENAKPQTLQLWISDDQQTRATMTCRQL